MYRCTTTMQEPKSPEQEPGGPAPATRGRPLFSTRTSTLFPSVFSPSSYYFLPFHSSILHSLHVIFSFFFPILLLLLLSTPYLTRNPPSSTFILSILWARSLSPSLPPLSLHASPITISHYFPSLSFLVVPLYLALVASTSLLSYCSSLPVMFKVILDLSLLLLL